MIIIKSYKATAEQDAALAVAERDPKVRRAIGDVLAARSRFHAEDTGNVALMEAFNATVAAGVEPTVESITATLAGMRASIDAQTKDACAADAQAKAAAKRHYVLMQPLRSAIGDAADALALEAVTARQEALGLRAPTRAEEVRMEMLRAGAGPGKVHEILSMLPLDPSDDERIAEAARKTKAARIADGKAATLRALLAKQPLLDLDAVEAVAPDYPGIAQALAEVRDALGVAEAAA